MILQQALMMAGGSEGPRLVGFAESTLVGNSTTVSVPVPTGVISGTMLTVFLSASNTGTWTMPAGWTEDIDQSSPSLCVARRIAGGSEPGSYTFTKSSSGALVGQMIAVRNASFDAIGTATTGGNGGIGVAGINSSGGLLIGVFAAGPTSVIFATPAGMQPIATTRNSTNAVIYTFIEKVSTGPTGDRLSNGMSGAVGSGTGLLYGIKRA